MRGARLTVSLAVAGVVVVVLLDDCVVSVYATPPTATSAINAAPPIANCGNRYQGLGATSISPAAGVYSICGRAPVSLIA